MGRLSIVPGLESKIGQPMKSWLVSRIHEGKTPDEIAAILGIGKSKAYELINDFGLKEALKSVKRQQKTGGGELKSYLEEYFNEKSQSGVSDNSIKKDRQCWDGFIWWLGYAGKSTELSSLLQVENIKQYFTYLEKNTHRFGRQFKAGVGKETISTYSKRMAAFVHWLQFKDIIPDEKKADPFSKMLTIKIPKKLPEDIPDEIIIKVLANFGDSFDDVRNKTIIEWFLETGMRLGGVSNLQTTQFDWERGQGRVVEKGGKERTIVLSDKLKTQVKKYAEMRGKVAQTNDFWVSSDGEPITDSGIYQMVSKLNDVVKDDIARLCPGQRFHPHIFRHLWAKHLALSEVPGFAIMVMAGWENLELVQHYAAAYTQEKAWSYINTASPLSKIT